MNCYTLIDTALILRTVHVPKARICESQPVSPRVSLSPQDKSPLSPPHTCIYTMFSPAPSQEVVSETTIRMIGKCSAAQKAFCVRNLDIEKIDRSDHAHLTELILEKVLYKPGG